jgi:hypothetical protein
VLIAADVRAYICREPVDIRKSIAGLSYLAEPLLAQNAVSGNLFVFVGRDRSKVKCLYWDRTGFALWYRRPKQSCHNFANKVVNSRRRGAGESIKSREISNLQETK